MNVRTNVVLPEELVAEVDEIAGARNRSRYIADALRKAVRRDRLREAVKRTAGAWTAEEYPEFATSEDVVAWVRARRAEETDPGPEETDARPAGHDLRDRSPARGAGRRGSAVGPRRGR